MNIFIGGLPSIGDLDQLHEECLLGKYVQKIIPKEVETKAKKALRLIHVNVCNVIHLNFFDKNRYF